MISFGTVREFVSMQSAMCLAPQTRVLVRSKGYVPACDVTVGTLLVVGQLEGESAGFTRVRAVKHATGTRFVRINHKVEVTEAHPFFTQSGEWLPAGDLRIGDWLMGRFGPERVSGIATLEREESPVIDIITDDPFCVEELITMSKSVYRASHNMKNLSTILPIQMPTINNFIAA